MSGFGNPKICTSSPKLGDTKLLFLGKFLGAENPQKKSPVDFQISVPGYCMLSSVSFKWVSWLLFGIFKHWVFLGPKIVNPFLLFA